MIDSRTFRDALGRFATGITVVATDGEAGPHGITVNAFLSLSLEPPLIGVAIDRAAHAHEVLAANDRYGVSVLSADQRPLSDLFAGRHDGAEPAWDRLGGTPVLDGANVRLACRVVDRVGVGDHTLFVGQVEAAETTDGAPLLYLQGRYGGWLDEG